ncbi:hypothetical protein SDC9_162989 [bioreactor metagenome]|uniref:Uncharacterized protein n=1 Tax=bioreactor metagenome TaxID=1076179 RepID=A0A645FMM0_9ZZZZ
MRLKRLEREGVAHFVTDDAVEIMRKRDLVDDRQHAVVGGDGEVAKVVARARSGLDR